MFLPLILSIPHAIVKRFQHRIQGLADMFCEFSRDSSKLDRLRIDGLQVHSHGRQHVFRVRQSQNLRLGQSDVLRNQQRLRPGHFFRIGQRPQVTLV